MTTTPPWERIDEEFRTYLEMDGIIAVEFMILRARGRISSTRSEHSSGRNSNTSSGNSNNNK